MPITIEDLDELMDRYNTALQCGDWSLANQLFAEFEKAEEAYLSDVPCFINDAE